MSEIFAKEIFCSHPPFGDLRKYLLVTSNCHLFFLPRRDFFEVAKRDKKAVRSISIFSSTSTKQAKLLSPLRNWHLAANERRRRKLPILKSATPKFFPLFLSDAAIFERGANEVFFRGRLFSPSEEELGERNSVVEIRDFFPGCLGGTVRPGLTTRLSPTLFFLLALQCTDTARERERNMTPAFIHRRG